MDVSFSIITVCLNDLDGLKATAESITEQINAEVEWVVIDGGSHDGTAEWLAKQDGVVWISEPDEGLYHAMNKGMERATGDYLIFINSGDELAGPFVLAQLSKLAIGLGRPADLIFGDSLDVGQDGRVFHRSARSHRWIWLGMFTQHQAMVFRRERIRDLSYDLDFQLSGDYGFVVDFLSPERGRALIARAGLVICRFKLGGLSTQKRTAALREDYVIRRELLGMSRAIASLLFAVHLAHYWVKAYLPALFRALRYRT